MLPASCRFLISVFSGFLLRLRCICVLAACHCCCYLLWSFSRLIVASPTPGRQSRVEPLAVRYTTDGPLFPSNDSSSILPPALPTLAYAVGRGSVRRIRLRRKLRSYEVISISYGWSPGECLACCLRPAGCGKSLHLLSLDLLARISSRPGPCILLGRAVSLHPACLPAAVRWRWLFQRAKYALYPHLAGGPATFPLWGWRSVRRRCGHRPQPSMRCCELPCSSVKLRQRRPADLPCVRAAQLRWPWLRALLRMRPAQCFLLD